VDDQLAGLLRSIEDRQKRLEDRLQRLEQLLESIRQTGGAVLQQASQLFGGAGGGL
jgi:hypothetical protein